MYINEYFEYLLGDPSYLGEDMFVMCWLGRHELTPRHDQNAINVYNKMHVSYKVKMEWGIRGSKYKWRRLMKHFDNPNTIIYFM
jgi:hypothetical protein